MQGDNIWEGRRPAWALPASALEGDGKARSSPQTGSPLPLHGSCLEDERGAGEADSCRPAPPESAPI